MPQIIAGQSSDLTKRVSELVLDLLSNNWPTTGFNPLKSEIGFGLDTWDDYGDIDIHVQEDTGESEFMTIGGGRTMNTDPVLINLFVRANKQEIPSYMGNAQRKIEEIVKDNAANLGQGVQILKWDGWGRIFIDDNLKDVWQAVGRASAIYFKVKV